MQDCSFFGPKVLSGQLPSAILVEACLSPGISPPATLVALPGLPGCVGPDGSIGATGAAGASIQGPAGAQGGQGPTGSRGAAGGSGSGSDCPETQCSVCFYEQ